MKNNLTETLAINTGNMIASLNLQVAEQQVAHKEQEETIKELKSTIDKLNFENANLRKKVREYESGSNSSDHKQVGK